MGTKNPHDTFIKSVMSNIENAKDFFNGVLPEELKQTAVQYNQIYNTLFQRSLVKIWLLIQKYIYRNP